MSISSLPVAAAVGTGRGAALTLKELGEVALVPEAGLGGDLRDELVGRLQQLADGVEVDGGDDLLLPCRIELL